MWPYNGTQLRCALNKSLSQSSQNCAKFISICPEARPLRGSPGERQLLRSSHVEAYFSWVEMVVNLLLSVLPIELRCTPFNCSFSDNNRSLLRKALVASRKLACEAIRVVRNKFTLC